MAGGDEGALDLLTELVRRFSLADGTKQNVMSNQNQFVMFCRQFGLCPLPAENDTLVKYVVFSAVVKQRTIGTIRNHLSAIKRIHLEAGYSVPTPSQYFPLGEVLRGAKRYASKPVKKMAPITPEILRRLVTMHETGSPVRCLMLLLFTTFSRLGSIIPSRQARHSPDRVTSHGVIYVSVGPASQSR